MTNRDLQKYAVYKQDGSPWTQEEYEIVSHLMGDKNTVSGVSIKSLIKKYIYTSDSPFTLGYCFMYSSQSTSGKTHITLSNFLDLIDYKDLALSNRGNYWTFQQL